MATKLRAAETVGGPRLIEGCWFDNGETLPFAAISATTTGQIFPMNIIPQDTSSAVSGGDFLSTSPQNYIQRLMGAQIMFPGVGTSAGVSASTTTNLGIAVYRTFAKLGAQIANAGGAITSLTVSAPGVLAPMPSGQTFLLTVAAGGTSQTYTTSAAVAPGALTIPVNSITPSSTYAVGTPIVGQAGNGILFGWLAAGTGTPAFPANSSVALPATTNLTAAVGGNTAGDPYGSFFYLLPGDTVALYCIQSSSTFTVPTGIVSTMAL